MDAVPEVRPEDIQSKTLVGWHQHCPVYLITCHGGYNLVLRIRNGRLEPLSQAPHPGIAKGLAKKRVPGITWTQLQKADDGVDLNGPLARKYELITDALRRRLGYDR